MATRLDPEAGYPNNQSIFIIFLIIIISDGELFIVLEDDTELSPLWYRAMVNMWQRSGNLKAEDPKHGDDDCRYGSNPHMAGVTLEWPAWVIAGDSGPIQNISSRVR